MATEGAMAEVGSVVTSQVDLLWSVALAVLLAGIYLVGRFQEVGRPKPRGFWSRVLLYSCVVSQVLSMFFGYLTYGAVVTMARCAPEDSGAVDVWCTTNRVTQANAFSGAELMALLQFGAFGLGLILFLILFLREPRAVAAAFKQD